VKETLYLAWRYLVYHRVKTAILVTSIMLIVYLPVGLQVVVDQSAAELTARAEATPLLVGAEGSPLELVLSSLYLESDPPRSTSYAEALRVADSGLAEAIPLYARFRAGRHPILGTTLEYFEFRGLRLAAGRAMAVLGECVVGAGVAERRGVGPGDALVSSPENVARRSGGLRGRQDGLDHRRARPRASGPVASRGARGGVAARE
jgi:putative ABC transport system permease protein